MKIEPEYVLVPVEPTKEMLEAGITAAEEIEDYTRDSFAEYRTDSPSDMPLPIYRAMIAAHRLAALSARPAVGEDAVTAAIEATGLLAGDEARDAARAAIAAITGDDHG